jgi:pimeloyl-ACP methyl ester carboxylesterase
MTGRFWDRLVPLLDGHADGNVLAVDMPGRRGKPTPPGGLGAITVDFEVTSVLADLDAAALPEPIVVVAHSSGGLAVPGIVAGLRERGVDVSAIVLNAASVPPEGGCGLDCMRERHAEGVRLAFELAEGDPDKLVVLGTPSDTERFRGSYGGDPLDDDTLAWILDPERLVPDSMNLYFQPVHWSRVPDDIPVTYIVNTLDRAMPPEKQEEMAARLPGSPKVVHLESGHIPPVTDPAGFAELLCNLA